MRNFYGMYPSLPILTFSLILVACAPKSVKVHQDYSIAGDLSGLELDKSQSPSRVYKRPGAPTLAAYNRFIIDPVQVNYSGDKMKELDPDQIEKMQEYFSDAMTKELQDAGYEIATETQSETLRISLTIEDLKAPKGGGAVNVVTIAAGSAVGLPLVPAIIVGEVTVKAVFREALTNRIDAVAVDRSRGKHFLNTKPWSTWADVKATFDKWAKGVRKAIDKAHGREQQWKSSN